MPFLDKSEVHPMLQNMGDHLQIYGWIRGSIYDVVKSMFVILTDRITPIVISLFSCSICFHPNPCAGYPLNCYFRYCCKCAFLEHNAEVNFCLSFHCYNTYC